MTIVGIHQPNFAPWIGYFYKIQKSDIFVFLDDVQFSKGSYQNRVKIKTPNGSLWLTVPVITKGKNFPKTNEIEINYKENWITKHLKTLEASYKKAEYFDKYYPILKVIYEKKHKLLTTFCTDLIFEILNQLEINNKKIVCTSDFEIDNNLSATDRLIYICQKLNATTYLSGKGGIKYQDEILYKENNIKLIYTDFNVFEYNQLWKGEFEAGLSIIDYLFNCDGEFFKLKIK